MTRPSKIYLLALTAALVAVSAHSSIAEGAQFHCSVEPCRYRFKPDGTVGTKGPHHSFRVENAEKEFLLFTCNQVTGEATSSTKTSSELTFTNVAYDECIDFSTNEKAAVRMNGCDYRIASAGTLSISCPEKKAIEMEIVATGCKLTIPSQGPLAGLEITNTGGTEITIAFGLGIQLTATVDGTKAQCILLDPSKPYTTKYWTGNTLITGETDPGEVMATAWWE